MRTSFILPNKAYGSYEAIFCIVLFSNLAEKRIALYRGVAGCWEGHS